MYHHDNHTRPHRFVSEIMNRRRIIAKEMYHHDNHTREHRFVSEIKIQRRNIAKQMYHHDDHTRTHRFVSEITIQRRVIPKQMYHHDDHTRAHRFDSAMLYKRKITVRQIHWHDYHTRQHRFDLNVSTKEHKFEFLQHSVKNFLSLDSGWEKIVTTSIAIGTHLSIQMLTWIKGLICQIWRHRTSKLALAWIQQSLN